MNYISTFRPVGPGGRPESVVVDAAGVRYPTITGGQSTAANVAKAQSYLDALAQATNNSQVADAAIANTVQPSSAQLAGLLKYLTLIQSASDTSTVETALAAL